MTRWVPHSLGVLAVIVVSAAGAPATALAAHAPIAVTSRVTPHAADGDPRPPGGLISTVLRLAGVRTGVASGCDDVDWRQGVTVRLEPCQAVAGADTVVLTGDGDRSRGSSAGAAGADDSAGADGSDGSAGADSGTVTSAGRTDPPKRGGDGNVAGGRPTQASSAVDGSPPGHAVDGTVDTAWRARGAQEWWQVDLGRSIGLSAVILNWDAGALPTGYTLLLSKDGETWARAGKVRGQPNGGPTVLELTAKSRFVRVQAKPPLDGDAGIALRDVRVFGSASAAADPVVAGHVGRLPGAGALDGLSDLGEGLVVPPADPGALQPAPATGFGGGPDPVTTAAMLVIVLVGVTGLVIGQTAGGGRHRQRGLAAVRLVVQRLRDLERMPRPGSPRSPGSPGTP